MHYSPDKTGRLPRVRIAEPDGFCPLALDLLRRAGDVHVAPVALSEIPAVLADYDVFWFRLGHRLDSTVWPKEPRCRIVATPVTGLDHIDLDACALRDVEVVSLRGEVDFLREVRATAELTIALLLAVMRWIPAASGDVRAGRWQRDKFRGRELYRKRAGIVGVGRLGTIVSGYLKAFGMEVVGYDPRPDFPPDIERICSIRDLFASCDIVSLHVAYTSATHHLVNADVLAQARPGLVLVNTSRGGVVDDLALVDALRRGRISAAALDVLEGEPEIARSSLLKYAQENDNLLIVPHIGGNTFESFEKTELFLARRVIEAMSKLPGMPR